MRLSQSAGWGDGRSDDLRLKWVKVGGGGIRRGGRMPDIPDDFPAPGPDPNPDPDGLSFLSTL